MVVDKTLNRIADATFDGRRHIIVLMTTCPKDSSTDLSRLRAALDSGSSQLDIIAFGSACSSRLLSLAHDRGGLTLVRVAINRLAEAADTIAYDTLGQYRLSVPVPASPVPVEVTVDFAGIHAVTKVLLPTAMRRPSPSPPIPKSMAPAAPAASAPADGSGVLRLRVLLAVSAGLILIAVAAAALRVPTGWVVLAGFTARRERRSRPTDGNTIVSWRSPAASPDSGWAESDYSRPALAELLTRPYHTGGSPERVTKHPRLGERILASTGAVAAPVSTVPSGQAAWQTNSRRRRTMNALKIIVVSLVVLQRFSVPGISTALCAPIVLAVVAYLLAHDLLVADTSGTGGYLIAVSLCSVAAVVSAVFLGAAPSLASLALLIVLYVPFCFRLRADLHSLRFELLEFFNLLMIYLAVVAIVQWGAQVAGWQYRDPLAILPRSLLIQTYNTFYPIAYGSSIMKTNAVVFLEPSFCSQYLALAIIVQLLLGKRQWRLALYAAALLTTVSGTGVLLLGLGLLVLAIRRGGRWTIRALLVVAVAAALISLTPLGKIASSRSREASTTNSSGNARFVAPYVQVFNGFARDVPTMLVGRGPGAVTRSTGSLFFNPERVEVNYPVVAKLAAEYGLLATVAFTWFIAVAILRGARSPTLGAVLLLLYFILSGSLLQPATVYTVLVLAALFRIPSRASRSPELNERRRGSLWTALN
ncbi:MAG: hypothetical protein ABJA34_04435 [Pseudonocardiales bacterium]